MATLWERTPQRLPPPGPLPLRGDSSEGFQGFFSEFCSEKATSSPVFMRELPTAANRPVVPGFPSCRRPAVHRTAAGSPRSGGRKRAGGPGFPRLPSAGGARARRRLPKVGRARARLGIEHILGYSPQARGRSERVNRTLQDRLVNELRVAGIRTAAAANRYLRDAFIPAFNADFGRPPADSASAFVALGRV